MKRCAIVFAFLLPLATTAQFNGFSLHPTNSQSTIDSTAHKSLWTKEFNGKTKSLVSAQPLANTAIGASTANEVVGEFGLGLKLAYRSAKWALNATYIYQRHQPWQHEQLFYEKNRLQPYFGRSEWRNNTVAAHFTVLDLSYRPSKFFQFNFGRNNPIIGEGRHSPMLGNFTGPFWNLQIQTQFWKLTYRNIYARFSHPEIPVAVTRTGLGSRPQAENLLNPSTPLNYRHKFSTIHTLDYQVAKWLKVGVFESVVWKPKDTLVNRGFDPNYLNPVIFFRPVEFSLGSSDNSILGAHFLLSLKKSLSIYGQWVIDEFLLSAMQADVRQLFQPNRRDLQSGWWANKHTGQLGVKQNLEYKDSDCFWRLEFNYARPFIYTHASPVQSYSQHGFSLGHPLGGNFTSAFLEISQQKQKWFWMTNATISAIGLDPEVGVFGNSLNLPYNVRNADYGNYLLQGLLTRTALFQLSIGRCIAPKLNLWLSSNVWLANQSNREVNTQTLGGSLRLSTYFLPQNAFFLPRY